MTTLREAQSAYRAAGRYTGDLDGLWGPRTAAAFMGALADAEAAERLLSPEPTGSGLTAPAVDYRTALEVGFHEAVVRQAYRDSEDTWTWSVGLTSATGHTVNRYIDNPQPMQHCLDIYVWALRRYARQVDVAFTGHHLTAAQYAGAVSFHWNTGAIGKASWVRLFKAGDHEAAEAKFKEWDNGGNLARRRAAEADLIWRGLWSGDGTITEYTALTSRHTPRWSSGVRRNVRVEMLRAFGQSVEPVLDTAPQPYSVPLVPTLTAA